MITKTRMQQALNGRACAQNKALKWDEVIHEYSLDKFNARPGDLDCDDYIDAMEYGISKGITVKEFDAMMKDAKELKL